MFRSKSLSIITRLVINAHSCKNGSGTGEYRTINIECQHNKNNVLKNEDSNIHSLISNNKYLRRIQSETVTSKSGKDVTSTSNGVLVNIERKALSKTDCQLANRCSSLSEISKSIILKQKHPILTDHSDKNNEDNIKSVLLSDTNWDESKVLTDRTNKTLIETFNKSESSVSVNKSNENRHDIHNLGKSIFDVTNKIYLLSRKLLRLTNSSNKTVQNQKWDTQFLQNTDNDCVSKIDTDQQENSKETKHGEVKSVDTIYNTLELHHRERTNIHKLIQTVSENGCLNTTQSKTIILNNETGRSVTKGSITNLQPNKLPNRVVESNIVLGKIQSLSRYINCHHFSTDSPVISSASKHDLKTSLSTKSHVNVSPKKELIESCESANQVTDKTKDTIETTKSKSSTSVALAEYNSDMFTSQNSSKLKCDNKQFESNRIYKNITKGNIKSNDSHNQLKTCKNKLDKNNMCLMKKENVSQNLNLHSLVNIAGNNESCKNKANGNENMKKAKDIFHKHEGYIPPSEVSNEDRLAHYCLESQISTKKQTRSNTKLIHSAAYKEIDTMILDQNKHPTSEKKTPDNILQFSMNHDKRNTIILCDNIEQKAKPVKNMHKENKQTAVAWDHSKYYRNDEQAVFIPCFDQIQTNEADSKKAVSHAGFKELVKYSTDDAKRKPQAIAWDCTKVYKPDEHLMFKDEQILRYEEGTNSRISQQESNENSVLRSVPWNRETLYEPEQAKLRVSLEQSYKQEENDLNTRALSENLRSTVKAKRTTELVDFGCNMPEKRNVELNEATERKVKQKAWSSEQKNKNEFKQISDTAIICETPKIKQLKQKENVSIEAQKLNSKFTNIHIKSKPIGTAWVKAKIQAVCDSKSEATRPQYKNNIGSNTTSEVPWLNPNTFKSSDNQNMKTVCNYSLPNKSTLDTMRFNEGLSTNSSGVNSNKSSTASSNFLFSDTVQQNIKTKQQNHKSLYEISVQNIANSQKQDPEKFKTNNLLRKDNIMLDESINSESKATRERVKLFHESTDKTKTSKSTNNITQHIELFNKMYCQKVFGEKLDALSVKLVEQNNNKTNGLQDVKSKSEENTKAQKNDLRMSSTTLDMTEKQKDIMKSGFLNSKIIITTSGIKEKSDINKERITNYYKEKSKSVKFKNECVQSEIIQQKQEKTNKPIGVKGFEIHKQTINNMSNESNEDEYPRETLSYGIGCTIIDPENAPESFKKMNECESKTLNLSSNSNKNRKKDTIDNLKPQNSDVKEDHNQYTYFNDPNFERLAELLEYEEKVLGIRPPILKLHNTFENAGKDKKDIINKSMLAQDEKKPSDKSFITPQSAENKSVTTTDTVKSSPQEVGLINEKYKDKTAGTRNPINEDTKLRKYENQLESYKVLKTFKERVVKLTNDPTAQSILPTKDHTENNELMDSQTKPNENAESANSACNSIEFKNPSSNIKAPPLVNTLLNKMSEQMGRSITNSSENMQYYTTPSSISKYKNKVEEVSVTESKQQAITTKDEVQRYMPYKISKFMLQSLFNSIFNDSDRRNTQEEKSALMQVTPNAKKLKTVCENARSSRVMVVNENVYPMISKTKIQLEYPTAEEISSLTDYNETVQYKHIPSVSKILNETMSNGTKKALNKWEKGVINNLGETKLNRFQHDQLVNDIQLHDCIRRHLMGTPVSLLTEGASEETKGCMMSLVNVFAKLKTVSLVESPVVHPKLPYYGIADCVGCYKGEPVVIEWKQAANPKSVLELTADAPIQLAAYIGAINFDMQYMLPVKSGMIVVAYIDGSPADTFLLPNEECQKYWKMWLKRLQQYIEIKQNNDTLYY